MANVRNFRSTKAQTRQLLRPVVITASGSMLDLQSYNNTSGGTAASGWTKTWYQGVFDPPMPVGDISKIIGNQKWVLGENIWVGSWYENMNWTTSTFGYVGDQIITSGATGSVTIKWMALDNAEGVLGTVNTTSFSGVDSQVTTIASLQITNMKFTQNMTVTGGGSYTGPAFAFRRDVDWNGVCTTDGTAPIGPNSCTNSAYMNYGPVKV
jgi:hypothetical protein